MTNKYIDKIFTSPEKLWLETIYLKTKKKEKFNERTLILELSDKLPKEFDPNQIDSKLLIGRIHLTLLGTALVNPQSYMISNTDKIIKTIIDLIKSDDTLEVISSEDISKSTKIPENDVKFLLGKIAEIGYYHPVERHFETTNYSIVKIYDDIAKAYLYHPSIQACLDDVAERIKVSKLLDKASSLKKNTIQQNKSAENTKLNANQGKQDSVSIVKPIEQSKKSGSSKYNGWKIVGNLSSGAQGTTHLVEKTEFENGEIYVLKKLINPKPKSVDRFKGEIYAGLNLSHPNILKVVDSDIEGSNPFLVSEYCKGGTLKNLDISKLTTLDKLKIFLQICEAVGFAHSNNPQIIHRDLKPENIFFQEDGKTPVVGDFGICFIDDEGERLTFVDEAVGARKYTPPELEEGRNEIIYPSSDVYSLGKILYWMLSGKIFDRERLREGNWDLTKSDSSPAMVFIYELLDEMIAQHPEERLENANEVAFTVKGIIQKIIKKAHPLDLNAPQECLYCGVGFYEKLLEFDYEYQKRQFGFDSAINMIGFDRNKWQMASLILICNHCGNEQRFRPFFQGWGSQKWKGLLPEGLK